MWSDISIAKNIEKALVDCGFSTPTEIQEKCINYVLNGEDLVGGSATGSGKTLAFGIPALQKLDLTKKGTEVLVLCPTRELAVQVAKSIEQVAKKVSKDISVVPIYGGADFVRQAGILVKKPKIVVGTPGRVLDHLRRKSLKLKTCNMLVLDEADVMLDMGFRQDIEDVISKFNSKPQMLLFSATMPENILKLVKKYLQNPKQVMIEDVNKPVKTVKQFLINVDSNHSKIEMLMGLVAKLGKERALIFCNTISMTDKVAMQLKKMSYKCDVLNGSMTQNVRKKVLDNFKNGKMQYLICTDVASRGLDIDNLTCVINYDMPKEIDWYIHRIGRTGRNGKVGRSFTLINTEEQKRKMQELKSSCGYIINEYDLVLPNDKKNLKSNVKKEKVKLKPKTANKKSSKNDFTKKQIAQTDTKQKDKFYDVKSFDNKKVKTSKNIIEKSKNDKQNENLNKNRNKSNNRYLDQEEIEMFDLNNLFGNLD